MSARLQEDFKDTIKAWPRFARALSIIRTPQQYKKATDFLDFLIDNVDKNREIEDLIEVVGLLIEDYENQHIEEPQGDPISSLRILMEEHRLNQKSLSELGSQGVVSEILHGKRKLNLRQIKALSARFGVSPSVFI